LLDLEIFQPGNVRFGGVPYSVNLSPSEINSHDVTKAPDEVAIYGHDMEVGVVDAATHNLLGLGWPMFEILRPGRSSPPQPVRLSA